jgi:hypothetical protein
MAMHEVYLEVGSKRVFAGSLGWPGWARAGKDEGAALENLAAHAERFEAALKKAKVEGFTVPTDFSVVERLKGDATTDFGAPSGSPTVDAEPLEGTELERYVAILRAAWAALDRASDAARGVILTKGPRGGGRSRAAIVQHVIDAEGAYLSPLDGRKPKTGDAAAVRAAIEQAIRDRATGVPRPAPRRPKKVWTPRYGVRRVAWHALDHAWEIEDRSSR